MVKKVDDWVIVVIIILAALLIANLFISGTIFKVISTIPDGRSVNLGPDGLTSGGTGGVPDYYFTFGVSIHPCSSAPGGAEHPDLPIDSEFTVPFSTIILASSSSAPSADCDSFAQSKVTEVQNDQSLMDLARNMCEDSIENLHRCCMDVIDGCLPNYSEVLCNEPVSVTETHTFARTQFGPELSYQCIVTVTAKATGTGTLTCSNFDC
jgi:hypothetical protein